MTVSPIALAVVRLADAIINGTASVADTGPETIISGTDREGVRFDFRCDPDGTIVCEDSEEE